MSPSFKALPLALLSLVSSASAFSFFYPLSGQNIILQDGDKIIVSYSNGDGMTMALNCGKTSDFTSSTAIQTSLQTWVNATTSVTYEAVYNSTYGNSQYCRVCTSASSSTCSGAFQVTAKSTGHISQTYSVNGVAPSGPTVSALPAISNSTATATLSSTLSTLVVTSSPTVSSTSVATRNGTVPVATTVVPPVSTVSSTTVVGGSTIAASTGTSAPAATSSHAASAAIQVQISGVALGLVAVIMCVAM